jgi:hypothetical protein
MYRYLTALLLLVALGGTPHPSNAAGVLPIAPVVQETPEWCWLAIGEMIFRHYGVPNANPNGDYQCGIVGILAGPNNRCWNNCKYCNGPAGSFFTELNWKQTMLLMFKTYPVQAEQFTGKHSPRITVKLSQTPLSRQAVAAEIDGQRPVVTGISPFQPQIVGATQHVALIVGYHQANGLMTLSVNDPYPFGSSNPYLAAGAHLVNGKGQYEIEYDTFGRKLLWQEAFYGFAAQ